MMKGAYHCDICDDGPFHGPNQVVGLSVIEDLGCMGSCHPNDADKHVCLTCAEYIAKAMRPKKVKPHKKAAA